MNLADLALRNRTSTLVLTAVLLLGGIVSFNNLSRLEDPEFTIKEALVVTPYPGATAAEVEEEVTDRIEIAVQQLGQLRWVRSKSERGRSTVYARIKDAYTREDLPQVWDELRRKVNDVQGQLPPGAGPSVVNDDYGDVWGVFVALYGPEYSYAELKEVAKLLRRELLLMRDVAKIQLFGDRREAVYVEPNRERMAQLGVRMAQLQRTLQSKNVVADAGRVEVGPEYIAIHPTGLFETVEDFETLLIAGLEDGRQIFLRDIARVRRGYVEPPEKLLRYDGNEAIGLGISTVSGGNVVLMGEAVERRVAELLPELPLGIEFGIVSLQSDAVTTAIDGFLSSLIQAVVIVIVVLLLFMGLRSGLIIGAVLVITICGTFIFMGPMGVALERISLGALIIALGMLVDNAIVVVDGMLVRIQAGRDPVEAAREVCGQTAWPLLGATIVAILAFGAIGLSPDSTGEFCRSLFQVVLASLGLSWVTAMTVTPLLGVLFLKPPAPAPSEQTGAAPPPTPGDVYDSGLYRAYRRLLEGCIRLRGVTTAVVLVAFGASLWGFRYVDNSFFPGSTRPQFMVDFWLPQGTHIDVTAARAAEAETYIRELPGVTHVATVVGGGAMRFLLTYTAEQPNSAYAQFLVDVEDYTVIPGLMAQIETQLSLQHPGAGVYGKGFSLGPGEGGKMQLRISGPARDELRRLSEDAMDVFHADGGAKAIRTDWRDRVKVLRPVLAEEEANRAGITRRDVADALRAGYAGDTLGVYRERDELLPIVGRAREPERSNVDSARAIPVWSPVAGRTVPLGQVVSGFRTEFEDGIIWRRNRRPTIIVHADPVSGTASAVLERVMPRVAGLEVPPGYLLEWGGEYEDSRFAQAGLMASLPFFFLSMVLIVILLFNALRQPAIIWLTVPLALIGVTVGLLVTGQPFGFMALLGFLSLSGMLIKNAIVLIDEIELQKREGKTPYDAVVTSGVSRLRPVAMAALTTALGMIPLLLDAFFVAMAVTIIFGLVFATVLTMVFVPTLYAIFFRIRP